MKTLIAMTLALTGLLASTGCASKVFYSPAKPKVFINIPNSNGCPKPKDMPKGYECYYIKDNRTAVLYPSDIQ